MISFYLDIPLMTFVKGNNFITMWDSVMNFVGFKNFKAPKSMVVPLITFVKVKNFSTMWDSPIITIIVGLNFIYILLKNFKAPKSMVVMI